MICVTEFMYISRFQVTYDFRLLQGMPELRKHDPKKYLDSLHVSSFHVIPKLTTRQVSYLYF